MKLLPPKELNSKLNDQKKAEIDAGMFLAKKIDKLHEDLAEAQEKHDLAIRTMNQEMEEFASDYVSKKSKLERELKDAEERLIELRRPLDSEWQKVREESEKLDIRTSSLIHKENQLTADQNENIILSQDLLERQSVVQNSEIRSQAYLEFSSKQKADAEKILATAKQYELEAKKNIEKREKNIREKENDIAYREVDINNNLRIIAEGKQWIEKEKRHLEARQRALKAAESIKK